MRHLAIPAAFVLAAAGFASAQDMAEAAAKERARRAQKQQARTQKPRVFTNDDLSRETEEGAAAAAAGSGAERAGSSAASRVSDNPDQSVADIQRGDARPLSGDTESQAAHEASWRDQAAALRRSLAEAEGRAKAAELQVEQLAGRMRLSTDTNEILRLAEERQAAEKTAAELRGALQALRAELAAFEERARRAGVPPGWIR